MSLITVGELYDGAYGSPDPDQRLALIHSAIRGFQRLGVSDEIMAVFARQRVDLRRRGMLIPDLDLLIASTAIAHNLTLMTRNTRHFSDINGLTIY